MLKKIFKLAENVMNDKLKFHYFIIHVQRVYISPHSVLAFVL